MIAVVRFRATGSYDGEQLRGDLESLLAALQASTGFVDGVVGRNIDEPALWVLTSSWASPGAYRRALSPLRIHPAWRAAIDEPTAYEPVLPGAVLNVHGARSLG